MDYDFEAEDTPNTEELDNETQMEPNNGCESPVISQSQKTIQRERERSVIRGRRAARGRNTSTSASVSPITTRVRATRTSTRSVSGASDINTTTGRSRSPLSQQSQATPPPETQPAAPGSTINNRERNRAGINATVEAARNDLHAARENRARSSTRSRSPTRSRSNSPGENIGAPNRMSTPDDQGDQNSTPSAVNKRGRKKTSIIWGHSFQKQVGSQTITCCNHCQATWNLSGSTSTALQHLKNSHRDKITPEEEKKLNSVIEPTTSDSTTPKRQVKGCYWNKQIEPTSSKGRNLNKQLCLAILSGSLPFNVLDNVQFAIFLENLSENRYKLPSRQYMTSTIVSAMYKATREVITEMLKNIQHIAFTTDAWRSFHKDSYITITAHVLDDDLTLHSFVLDTSEIKDRHTSANLFKHIDKVLKDWGILTHSPAVTLNYNNVNENDIYDESNEAEDDVDYLLLENFYGDEENQTQMFESQTQIDGSQTLPPSSRSGVRNVIPTGTEHTTTFVSDNASDISKALRQEGGFVWFGCAGHHMNLIVRNGFKKNQTAARLLTKCKNIVKAVNHSQPILYDVRKYQEELDIPISAIMQEMTTRWWSILHMLTSILNNTTAITLGLSDFGRTHLLLTVDEKTKIKDLIALLKPFKEVGEVFGRDKDITLTHIVPMFLHLQNTVLFEYPNDSGMIKDMKKHMLTKLENRYNQQQWKFLKTVTILDPRVKGQVINEYSIIDLKAKVKEIVQATVPDQIPATQSQEYQNLQNNLFTTPPASSGPSQGHSHSLHDNLYNTVYVDDSDDEIPANNSQLDEKIDIEFNSYKAIKISAEKKKD